MRYLSAARMRVAGEFFLRLCKFFVTGREKSLDTFRIVVIIGYAVFEILRCSAVW